MELLYWIAYRNGQTRVDFMDLPADLYECFQQMDQEYGDGYQPQEEESE